MKINNSFFFLIEADLTYDWQGQRSNFLKKVKGVTFFEYLLKRLGIFGISLDLIYIPRRKINREIYNLSKKLSLNLLWQSKASLKKIIKRMDEEKREYLLRIKAGSVFIDSYLIEGVIERLKNGVEYVFLSGFPIGVDLCGFSRDGLRKLLKYGDGSFDISLFREKFKVSSLLADKERKGFGLNLNLNRDEDIRFARFIINSLKKDNFSLADVLNLLDKKRKSLSLFQKKTRNIEEKKYYSKKLNMIEANRQCKKLSSYPFLLQIETSTRCNLRCLMCQRERSDFTEPQRDMEMDIFEKLTSVFPYISQASLFGIGEPLLNQNFNQMFKILRENFIDVLFYTNGMVIDKEMADLWVREGLRDVIFSLDGVNPEKVESLRKGVKFEVVLDKIRMINRLKKIYRKKLPNIRISYTIMRSNLEELLDMVKLCKNLGVGKIIVTFMVAFIEKFREESLFYHQEITNKIFKEAIILGKKLGIDVQVPGFFNLSGEKKSSGRKFCLEPWTTSYIFHDGKVRPCCFTDEIMGDLKKESFEEIWNGTAYQRLRETVNSDDPPFECSRCHFVKYQNVDDIRTHIKI